MKVMYIRNKVQEVVEMLATMEGVQEAEDVLSKLVEDIDNATWKRQKI